MTTIQPGEFWVADIPFTDQRASKKRPVLILWLDGEDAVCAVVTSAQQRTPTDIPLQDWKTSGLRLASTVRLSRLDCLEMALFVAKIGRITEADSRILKTTWQELIKPQF